MRKIARKKRMVKIENEVGRQTVTDKGGILADIELMVVIGLREQIKKNIKGEGWRPGLDGLRGNNESDNVESYRRKEHIRRAREK